MNQANDKMDERKEKVLRESESESKEIRIRQIDHTQAHHKRAFRMASIWWFYFFSPKSNTKRRLNKNTQMTILSSFITINVDILACESKEEFSFGIELWPLHATQKKIKIKMKHESCVGLFISLRSHSPLYAAFFRFSLYLIYMYTIRICAYAYKDDTLSWISQYVLNIDTQTQHTHTHTQSFIYVIRYIDLIVVISYYIGINFFFISSFFGFSPKNKSFAFCLHAFYPFVLFYSHSSMCKCRMRMSLRLNLLSLLLLILPPLDIQFKCTSTLIFDFKKQY